MTDSSEYKKGYRDGYRDAAQEVEDRLLQDFRLNGTVDLISTMFKALGDLGNPDRRKISESRIDQELRRINEVAEKWQRSELYQLAKKHADEAFGPKRR